MAYVNVRDWSVEQVTEWLKGLDSVVTPYTKSFLNNEVKGHQLLSLRSDDLEHLGVYTLGHQEAILEAVEHLRNFHYKLDKENLQMLALRLSCSANSLYNELALTDENCKVVPTQTMSDVHNIITAIKPLVCWLDRSPFRGDKDYVDCKSQLLQLSFEMATSAHRDIFSEKPLRTIRNISNTLAQLADHIIQEMSDPMILQPASLALATLKKKEQELGFFLLPSNYAIHQIAAIKHGSPAHNSSKIEEGDEIVQVNYQTVVGWQRKNVLLLLQESPPEIVLTLKKRPRHSKVYGQIYMKPYRLPSKKRATPYSRWNDNLPSPQLLAIHDLPQIPAPRLPPVIAPPETETELSSSSDSEPLDSPLDGSRRVYPLKPRPVLQRRNTITGASPTSKRPHQAIEQYWQQLKNQAASRHSSSYNIQTNKFGNDSTLLRDKSVSCGDGFELTPRPTTVIGLSQNKNAPDFRKHLNDKSFKKKKVNFEETNSTYVIPYSNKIHISAANDVAKENTKLNTTQTNLHEENSVSVSSLSSLNESIDFIDEGEDITDRSNMKAEWQKQIVEEIIDTINYDSQLINVDDTVSNVIKKDAALADVHVLNSIKKFDEKGEQPKSTKPKVFPKNLIEKPPELPQKPDLSKKPAIPPKVVRNNIRGTLNKSHSTPAYDQSDPPIEPENDCLETNFIKPLNTDKNLYGSSSNQSNQPIKYELGIPIVENINSTTESFTIDYTYKSTDKPYVPCIRKQSVPKKEPQDIPPKPPPRIYPLELPNKNTNETGSYISLETQNEKTYFLKDTVNKDSFYSIEAIEPNKSPLTSISEYKASTTTKELKKSNSGTSQYISQLTVTENIESSFEPRNVSTPISKQIKMEFPEVDFTYSKSTTNLENMRIASDNKISPTNSIVRAMMYSSKNKSGKKKSSIAAKRRKVSVKDVSPGELQGFLYQRSRSKQIQPAHWEKRWFVLNGSCLYGFKSKDSLKACCLIFLSGFTVSVATEVKSRSHAFKVYHTGTVFYFSAEDSETLTSWIELITAATLSYDNTKSDSLLFSESDESDSDQKPSKSDSIKKFGSLKKLSSSKSNSSTPSGSSSLDRKWFFNKSNSLYKNSLPVPTAQFRSYRKIPSTTVNAMESMSTGNFTSHIPDFSPRFELKTNESQSNSSTNLDESPKSQDPEQSDAALKAKQKPLNYVHSSNPNLCEINDFHLRSFHKLQSFQQCSDNLAGFVTLEELMNRQTEEQKLNPHTLKEDILLNSSRIRADVVYGEVPIKPNKNTHKKVTHTRSTSSCSEFVESTNSKKSAQDDSNSSNNDSTSFCFGKRGSLKKHKKDKDIYDTCTYPKTKASEEKPSRSLPRAHKLQDSNVPSKSKKKQSKSFGNKEYSVSYVDLKDQSSEMVYCPETLNDVHFAKNRTLDGRSKTGTIVRQHSLTSMDKKHAKATHTSSNLSEKLWIDSLKKSDKVADRSAVNVKLKSAVQYTPMCLPLAPDHKDKLNPTFAFELNLDEKVCKSGKFKNLFGKQTDSKKEKTFLGSPKLRRAIFEKHSVIDSPPPPPLPPLAWSSDSTQIRSQHILESSSYIMEESSRTDILATLSNIPATDYPGLEYPPVFEPETYSLSDPQCSLSLLRKQDKQNRDE